MPTLLYFPVAGSVYHKFTGKRTLDGLEEWVYGDEWKETPAYSVFTHKVAGGESDAETKHDDKDSELMSLLSISQAKKQSKNEAPLMSEETLSLSQV